VTKKNQLAVVEVQGVFTWQKAAGVRRTTGARVVILFNTTTRGSSLFGRTVVRVYVRKHDYLTLSHSIFKFHFARNPNQRAFETEWEGKAQRNVEDFGREVLDYLQRRERKVTRRGTFAAELNRRKRFDDKLKKVIAALKDEGVGKLMQAAAALADGREARHVDLPDELGIKDPRPTYAVVRRRLRALGVVLKPYGITFHCLRTGTGSVVLNFFAR
jgi:hypothetical protein